MGVGRVAEAQWGLEVKERSGCPLLFLASEETWMRVAVGARSLKC